MLFQIKTFEEPLSALRKMMSRTENQQKAFTGGDWPSSSGCPHSLYLMQECGTDYQALGAPKINPKLGRIIYNPNIRNAKYIR